MWSSRGVIHQIIAERQQALLQSPTPATTALYQTYLETRRQLAGLALAPGDGNPQHLATRRQRLSELTRRKEQLERDLAGELPEFATATSTQPPSPYRTG